MELLGTTQNSGVLVNGSCYNDNSSDFYGRLLEIVVLDYYGKGNCVTLFKCEWFDTTRGTQVDRNGLVRVDIKSRLNSNEPFILASQASQVFYAKSVTKKDPHWYAVIKTKARSCYDVPEEAEEEGEDDYDNVNPHLEAYPETYQEDDFPVIVPNDVSYNAENVQLCIPNELGEEVDPEELRALTRLDQDKENEADREEDEEDNVVEENVLEEEEEDEIELEIGFV